MERLKHAISSVIDRFYFPFLRRIIPSTTFRYAACGGGNMLFDIFLFAVMYNFVLRKHNVDLGFVVVSPYVMSNVIVYPITFFTGFWLMNNVALAGSPLSDHAKLFRYLLTSIGAFIMTVACLKFFVEVLHIYPTPAKMLATGVSIVFSYLMQLNFTFPDRRPPKGK
ncbi:MAG: GtrA family protein [Rikenellaceae bacterium]|jgi:putative flippase GtrA|nr:GtrA family protein [Rikenellaceae bacterium]